MKFAQNPRTSRFWNGKPFVGKGSAPVILLSALLLVTLFMRWLEIVWPGHVSRSVLVMGYLLVINVLTLGLGLTGGIGAALISFAALNYVFIEPRGTMLIHSSEDLIVLLFFLVVAGVNSQLLGKAQIGRVRAEQRERDATALSEFSLSLTSLRHQADVAELLARQVSRLIQPHGVEVILTGDANLPVAQAHAPATFETPAGILDYHDIPPSDEVAIESPRAQLGNIRVWRTGQALDAGEQRLVRTMAGMTALALERIRLAQVEARANVLEESDRLKSALLSSVSHELRTPLSALRAGAESLNHGLVSPGSSAGHDLIANMDEAARHLSKLVDNVLDMSRIEAGVLKPRREWCVLADILMEAMAHVQTELRDHPVTTDVSEDLPLVPIDPNQIDQVFTNLLTNAAKYAPAGSPIDIAAMAETEASARHLRITVLNRSAHIPANDLERIFDKFYRVTDSFRVLGTGLGLSICKGIVEAHGGRIWATNMAGGVAFSFTLPLQAEGMAEPISVALV